MQQQCYHKAGETRRLKEIRPPLAKPCFAVLAPASDKGTGAGISAGECPNKGDYVCNKMLSGLAGMVSHAGVKSPIGEDTYVDVKEWLAGMGDNELNHLDEVMENVSTWSSTPSTRKDSASWIV